jgi:membrane-bound lytic murein transglycosylase D
LGLLVSAAAGTVAAQQGETSAVAPKSEATVQTPIAPATAPAAVPESAAPESAVPESPAASAGAPPAALAPAAKPATPAKMKSRRVRKRSAAMRAVARNAEDVDGLDDADGEPSVQDEVESQETIGEAPPGAPEVPSEKQLPPQPRHGVRVQETPGEPFPVSPVSARQRDFWIRVFTRLPSDHGLVHDDRIADPVYEEIDLSGLSPKARRNLVKHRLYDVAASLRALADAQETGAEPDERGRALRALLPPNSTPADIREASRHLRVQRGLADRFEDGVVRAGAFEAEIRRILAEYEVPEDLVFLPHVESSYNNATRSKAGAVGVWQFTAGTGRLYMTVGHDVDERYDPLTAARAAAKFLRQNYERLGTWPLAITAYNHGPQSLEKIVGRMGTTDLGYLIENYNGPLFKFASKNFYAEFLAARHVASRHHEYFGEVERDPALTYNRVELPFFLAFEQALRVSGVNRATLLSLNPGLRAPVVTGARYIPKGYRLRIPAATRPPEFLAAVPETARAAQQKVQSEVVVARGDTLYSIGRRNNIKWAAIAAANNLGPNARLRPGQRLILPGRGATPAVQAVAAAEERPAAPRPQQIVAQPTAAAPASPLTSLFSATKDSGSSGTVLATAAPGLVNMAVAPELTHLSPLVSQQYQHLDIKNYDAAKREGQLLSVYGESLGHYADWAQVSAEEIRALNDLPNGKLQPGWPITVPLRKVDPETFSKQRAAYHRQREESFFAEYSIVERKDVRVGRGQTPWNLARMYSIPMWLLYRENPVLLQRPPQAGMKLTVPVLQEAAPAAAPSAPETPNAPVY